MGDGAALNFNLLNDIIYKGRENRQERYRVYDSMDDDSDISRALDMIAEHCTSKDPDTRLPFTIRYSSDEVQVFDADVLVEMLQQWNRINDWDNLLWRTVRNVVKYGDAFFIRDPDDYSLTPVPPHNVIGIYVDPDTGQVVAYHMRDLKKKYDYMQTDVPTTGTTHTSQTTHPFTHHPNEKRWEAVIPAEYVLHLSLSEGREAGGNGQHDDIWPFGESFLERVFKTYKQRDLLEQSALIHRAQRAPSRRIWYVDVGKMRPDLINGYIQRFKDQIIQKSVPSKFGGTDQLDSVYNPISQLEDFFLPQTANSRGSKVDTLEGSQWNSMDDLEYFTGKMIRGLRVPTSFMLGPEEGGAVRNDGQVGVAYIQEMQFARFCERVQDVIDNDLDFEFKMFVKFRDIQIDSSEYNLKMMPPMNFDEYREGALNDERLNRLSTATGFPFMSRQFALSKFAGWSQEDIQENERLWMEENRPGEAAQYNQDTGMGGFGAGAGAYGGLSDLGPPPLDGETFGGDELGMDGGDGLGATGGDFGDLGGGAGSMATALPAAGITGAAESAKPRRGSTLMESEDEIPDVWSDESDEPGRSDGLLDSVTGNADEGDDRPRLTLQHLRKLRLEFEKNRVSRLKRLELVSRMYNSQTDSTGGF